MKVILRKREVACNRPSAEPMEGHACQSGLGSAATGASGETRLTRATCAARGAMDRRSCGVGLGLTMVTREMGPVLQGWLEIREVEIEGIHHVTKPEILERARLESRHGAPSSQHSVSCRASADACLDQGGDGRTPAATSAACHRIGTHAAAIIRMAQTIG